ncbi:MAG: right-handed parallel beta-helix repeat-containing protein [Armatimonadetes bacterium]|nr:right-handed parallel beta-helix repeat-containing protein [Armatimonadota bacterium]
MHRWLLSLLAAGLASAATLTVPAGGDLLGTVAKARDLPRPVTIELGDGTHYLPATLRLGPRDSGLKFVAARGAKPVLSGGRPVTGWQVRDGIWEVTLPEVAAGAWRPRQLFVGGQRATVCRAPNTGFYRVGGYDNELPKRAFTYNAGELAAWPDLASATLVVLHSWETSVMPIASVDPARRRVVLGGDSVWNFGYWGTPQRWYVEGVAAAFDAPGEWHLDARTGLLRYRPLPGQTPANTPVVAGHLVDVVRVNGDPRVGLPVTDVSFSGLTFAHGDWALEPAGHSDPQAVCSADGNVSLRGAVGCSFADCRFAHMGSYALALRGGSRDCRVERCEFVDVGAGAVRLGETFVAKEPEQRCEGHVVDNCWVHDYGQVYAGGVGIWLAMAGDCRISHNDIHDGWYTGISVGWDWGRAPTTSHGDQILDNHIHHIVKGRLSDAGGIYTLGELDGGRLAGNVIHDVLAYTEPDYSWGIYLDSESHGLTVEDNRVWAIEDGLMLHNGAYNNVIRRNVFAQAADYLIWRSPSGIPMPNTFTDNIGLVTQGSLFLPDGTPDTVSTWDRNTYWRADGRELLFMDDSFAEWQARGVDKASRVADPKLRLPLPIGQAGLYGDPAWVAKPRAVAFAPTVMPTTKVTDGPQPVIEDFESTAVGQAPPRLVVSLGKEPGGSVQVSDQQPAVGRHCLRFADAKALEHTWEPHAFWQPRLRKGTARLTFHWWVGPGSEPWTEWRSAGQPFKTGPSIRIGADRQLVANGKALVKVPEQTWLKLTITCPLGKAAHGHYGLTLAVGEAAATDLGEQTCDPAFDNLGWLGFVALADATGEFRIDDVRLTIE